MSNIPVIKILDVKINPLTKAEVLALIKNHLLDPHSTPQQLVTTNPEFIMAAQDDEEFKNIINNSWLSVADGYGIRLAGKYQQAISNFQFPISKIKKLFIGCQIAWLGITRNNKKLDVVPETITGTDLVPEICRLLSVSSDPECHPRESEDPVAISQTCQKIFLLGGFGDVPRLAAERLNSPPYEGGVNSRQKREEEGVNKSQKNILINYSTFEHLSSPPYEGGGEEGVNKNSKNILIDYTPFESPNIIEKINSFAPSVLFVALNHPRAQKWINANLPKMPSVKLAIGVGGAFDYLSGKIKRAPKCLQGFEWLYRLINQPRRFKRIYTAVIEFPLKILKAALIYKK